MPNATGLPSKRVVDPVWLYSSKYTVLYCFEMYIPCFAFAHTRDYSTTVIVGRSATMAVVDFIQ